MGKYRKLSHTTYKCEYQIVWTPKYRFRVLKDGIASELTRDIYGLSSMKEVIVEELSVQQDQSSLLLNTTKVKYFFLHGLSQRENSDKDIEKLSYAEKKDLLGQSFLVKRLFREYCWDE